MRIVLVVPAFPKLSETFVVSHLLGLLAHGWDVQVVCACSAAADWAQFPALTADPGLRRRVHVTWPDAPRWRVLLLWLPALLRCLLQRPLATARYLVRGWRLYGSAILRRFYQDQTLILLRPDVVHFEFGALAQPRMALKRLLDCRITVSFRGYDLNFAGLEQSDYYRTVWEGADRLHLLGRDLWLRAQRRGCPPDKPHALIPPAIDTAVFHPTTRTVAARPLRILSVGRLVWKKGYDYALEAVRLLLDAGIACEFRIAGEGEYLEALTFARYRLGLEAQVHFLGALSPVAVREQMQWADVLLHTAVSEGFSNAVMEAQAMQLPVVCSDADGLPENVADGETGFVVPRRDPRAVADRLAFLALSPDVRLRMGLAGRRRVVARFNLADQARAFDAFFEAAVAPGIATE